MLCHISRHRLDCPSATGYVYSPLLISPPNVWFTCMRTRHISDFVSSFSHTLLYYFFFVRLLLLDIFCLVEASGWDSTDTQTFRIRISF